MQACLQVVMSRFSCNWLQYITRVAASYKGCKLLASKYQMLQCEMLSMVLHNTPLMLPLPLLLPLLLLLLPLLPLLFAGTETSNGTGTTTTCTGELQALLLL
jgi:hypothetical protein